MLTFFILFSCYSKEKENYPEEIVKSDLQNLFDKSKWEIYKWNLLFGEEYTDGYYDPRGDTILTNFEGLNLYYEGILRKGDTLTIMFDFSTFQFDPIKASLRTDVSFIDSTIIGLDLFDHIGIIYSNPEKLLSLEDKFTKYLQSKEPSDLNPWLLQEAKKRAILK